MAVSDHVDLPTFMEGVKKRNPGQPEFCQAVQEVAEDIFDFIEDKEQYHAQQILRRIAEPDRVVSFRVCWEDDNGNVRVQRGWRVQNNNAIGPYKGGIRFHPSVTESVLKFLAFEQTFKNALTGLPMGGGKGGSNFNPKGKSVREIMRFCQSFMTELYRHIGADIDVPAGDIGVGGREIGFMFGQYKRITNEFTGVLTGKGLECGGSLIRTEATGYGAVYFLQNMLATQGPGPGRQDRGHLGLGQRRHPCGGEDRPAGRQGADPVGFGRASSTIPTASPRRRSTGSRSTRPSAAAGSRNMRGVQGRDLHARARRPWGVPCDVALPCATQNELLGDDAETLVTNGCMAVSEGANMPTDLDGVHVFKDAQDPLRAGQGRQRRRRRGFRPGDEPELRAPRRGRKTSCSRCSRTSWTASTQLRRPTATQGGGYIDYVKGANIAGFKKVADAMLAFGVV